MLCVASLECCALPRVHHVAIMLCRVAPSCRRLYALRESVPADLARRVYEYRAQTPRSPLPQELLWQLVDFFGAGIVSYARRMQQNGAARVIVLFDGQKSSLKLTSKGRR